MTHTGAGAERGGSSKFFFYFSLLYICNRLGPQAQNEEGDVIVALRRQNKMDCKAMRSIIRTDALEELLTDAQLAAFGLPPGEKACRARDDDMPLSGGDCARDGDRPRERLPYLLFYLLNYSLTHSLTHLLTLLLAHSLTYSLTYLLTHSLT